MTVPAECLDKRWGTLPGARKPAPGHHGTGERSEMSDVREDLLQCSSPGGLPAKIARIQFKKIAECSWKKAGFKPILHAILVLEVFNRASYSNPTPCESGLALRPASGPF